MGIIILILKIIGIVILVLLIALAILCFFPFPYILKLSCGDDVFKIDFSYIIFFFDFLVSFKDKKGMKYKMSVLGKVITKNKTKDEKAEKAVSIDESDFIQNKEIVNEITDNKDLAIDLYKRATEYSDEINAKNNVSGNDKVENDKYIHVIDKIIDAYKNIFSQDVIDMIKMISHEVVAYHKCLIPKTLTIDAEIGTGDPYDTGSLLARFAWLYAKYGDKINITPYFDKKVIDINAKIIGRPMLINILMPVKHLLFNKRFRDIMFKKDK